jgi:hypothetical protein
MLVATSVSGRHTMGEELTFSKRALARVQLSDAAQRSVVFWTWSSLAIACTAACRTSHDDDVTE